MTTVALCGVSFTSTTESSSTRVDSAGDVWTDYTFVGDLWSTSLVRSRELWHAVGLMNGRAQAVTSTTYGSFVGTVRSFRLQPPFNSEATFVLVVSKRVGGRDNALAQGGTTFVIHDF